ncbi:hypothetical protein EV356DRAFT_297621 [Viridothelium virens]|uniref:Uncharacterized protein n=1 Tax=Viridothelium virens TaxID=1048519 RepID=A0A6A6H0X6_VIRVR|nr:hypothetical protein EV356DRAFT_297621 [Viridothelium virens]
MQVNNLVTSDSTNITCLAPWWSLTFRQQTTPAMDGQIPDHLYEWLEMTGWFDEHYRERALNRHRRRKKLSHELAKLAQEDEADRGFLAQARSASVAEICNPSMKPTPLDDQPRTLTEASSPLLEKDAQRGRKRSFSTAQRNRESQGSVQKFARNDHADRPRHVSDSRVKNHNEHPGYRVKGAVGDSIAQRRRTSRVESGMNGSPNLQSKGTSPRIVAKRAADGRLICS